MIEAVHGGLPLAYGPEGPPGFEPGIPHQQ